MTNWNPGNNSKALFEAASRIIPGGVNSPVRAFKTVGLTPFLVERADGAFVYDVDGNEYVDFMASWGPLILGHNNEGIRNALVTAAQKGISFGASHEAELTLAKLITSAMKNIEMVRLVNSGTEATMSAVRLARGYTKRDKIVKFEGCYHGHADAFLINAGSGAATLGVPSSPGVPAGAAKDTLTAVYNDVDSVQKLFEVNKNEIAAVILEPVAGNMGCIPPKPGFLEAVRNLCTLEGTLLIFDEVITGFRVAKGGAQERYGVDADLTTLGKIIGGGMPVGAFGGKKEIMEQMAPVGPVYQAGTLAGNPLATACGIAVLEQLLAPGVYNVLEEKGAQMADIIENAAAGAGQQITLNRVGSMMSFFFNPGPVTNFTEVCASDIAIFNRLFGALLAQGMSVAPSGYEALFVSLSHSDEVMARVEKGFAAAFETLKG
ncbi:MAG: glutamate-1-semialdehyde 2,1-aminomutase [Deltaproteobacteria bacterium]|nr:glutamate-1-semialdehyde 2,1-aminomutase [Deltaproteobacteria bacterium]MBN2672368.1 glutamate-1-semialdehyde 2,1-aminomutase [Deltaproteobacteria bacterium]